MKHMTDPDLAGLLSPRELLDPDVDVLLEQEWVTLSQPVTFIPPAGVTEVWVAIIAGTARTPTQPWGVGGDYVARVVPIPAGLDHVHVRVAPGGLCIVQWARP